MAAAILRFEDSLVTGPDSLRVSRLPAADKGGKWEICGICDGIEPDVFNRLKALLNAGRREEAWEGCLQYVLDNTAAVRSWLGSAAFPGVEFILRDHFFNSGSRNTGKILQRALNINGAGLVVDGIPGKQTRQMLKTVLAQTGGRISLHSERTAQIILPFLQTVPRVQQGWLNRCDDAFSMAQELV